MKQIILSTLELNMKEVKYRYIGQENGTPIKIRTNKSRTLGLTAYEMKDLASTLPEIASSNYVCVSSEEDKALDIIDYALAEAYIHDAIEVLIDNINNQTWIDGHVTLGKNGLNIAKYPFSGIYYGDLVELDVTIMYAFDTKLSPITTYIGNDIYDGPMHIDSTEDERNKQLQNQITKTNEMKDSEK